MASVKYYARGSGSCSLELMRVENKFRLHILINPESFHKTTVSLKNNELVSVNPDTLSHIILLNESPRKKKNNKTYPSDRAISATIELAMISNATVITSPLFDFWKILSDQLPKRLLSSIPFQSQLLSVSLFSFYNPLGKQHKTPISKIIKSSRIPFSMGVQFEFPETTKIACLSHWKAIPKSPLLTDSLDEKFTAILPLTDRAELLPFEFVAKRNSELSENKPLIRKEWELITTVW